MHVESNDVMICQRCGRYFAFEKDVLSEEGRLCKKCGSGKWEYASFLPLTWRFRLSLRGLWKS